MSFIIEMLKDAMKEDRVVGIITEEGQNSYKHTGRVEKMNDVDILFKIGNGRKLAIAIKNIVKVED